MTLVVKLGSSIVAADDGELRVDVLDSVCAQVAELEQGGERVVMVTSGAIARGIRLLDLPARPKAMDELQAASAVGQGDLFRAYQSRLAEGGTRSAQVLLTAADIAARTNYLNARQTLRRLIDWGVVPVVNENDTTATDEISFGDNDFLAAQVGILLDARLLVLLSDVDGLHRSDPRADPDAELIVAVEDFSELAGMKIGSRTSSFGSGGMRSKVAAAEMAAESGIPATICNGTKPGTLLAAARSAKSGTRFVAQEGKASSFKLWLKYAKPARGRLMVDDGAARVLRQSGSSLLPVGITNLDGEFKAGDAVEVTAGEEVVGKGIVDYASHELLKILGLKTEQVRELLPHAADEVIHRDRFVLMCGPGPSHKTPTRGPPGAFGSRPPALMATLCVMAVTTTTVAESCVAAQRAARKLGAASTEAKDAALMAIARLLGERVSDVLEANAADLADERAEGLTPALRDRLALSDERVAAMAEGVRAVAALSDPVGEELERKELESGLDLRKVRVPLGVVAVVYEARPNVTIDCAALTIKSGNAIVLRGSHYAERTNGALAAIVREALAEAGLPEDAAVLLAGGGHEDLAELATQEETVDLLIPRGGEGLKNALKDVATVPVIFAAAGNCHVYVHADADLEMARRIAVNAKTQRPGVCNAAETLLVDAAVVEEFLPAALAELREAGVELVGDERARASAAGVEVGSATDEDWGTEYLDLKLAVAVVDSLDDAIEHVNRHGTRHSEAIVTRSDEAAERFTAGVDAAVVYTNASTRFTDGFEFGMGAEIGNSTQKLHARGPIGLRELTTYKYVVRGDGQVRE